MRPRHLLPAFALAASTLLSGTATASAATAPAGTTTSPWSSSAATSSASQPTQKEQLLYILNAERAAAGRAPLALHDGVAHVAREWAARMAQDWWLRHRPDLGAALDRQGVAWRTSGENVGYGRHVVDVHRGFMNSPSHRDILMSQSFSEVGIGVTARDGRVWVTVDFVGR